MRYISAYLTYVLPPKICACAVAHVWGESAGKNRAEKTGKFFFPQAPSHMCTKCRAADAQKRTTNEDSGSPTELWYAVRVRWPPSSGFPMACAGFHMKHAGEFRHANPVTLLQNVALYLELHQGSNSLQLIALVLVVSVASGFCCNSMQLGDAAGRASHRSSGGEGERESATLWRQGQMCAAVRGQRQREKPSHATPGAGLAG